MSNLSFKFKTDHETLSNLKRWKRFGVWTEQKQIGNNTYVVRRITSSPDEFLIYYHDNAIALITPKFVTLSNAGWGTTTTRNRLNMIARDNGINIRFGQQKNVQVIHTERGTEEFYGQIRILKISEGWQIGWQIMKSLEI